VHAGDEADASFLAYPSETWTGHVLFVGELLDPDTRTLQVRVAFDNAERRLHPGMFATVTFRGPPQPQIVVPTTATLLLGDASYVFVQNGDWRFEKRRVTTGASTDATHLVITEGLRAGERIVTANAFLLQ
jgi:cobalt-zinc-cadmium efflux system membrane fusion protein